MAVVLCVIAVAALGAAIRDMVLGTDTARRGWVLRTIAVVAFLLAVVLNAAR